MVEVTTEVDTEEAAVVVVDTMEEAMVETVAILH
jgi:hypothetical protein